MKLAPSVTHVVICVSHAFCSTDQEKRETARSLILEMPFGHQIAGFLYQAAFKHSIHLVWTKIESEIEGDEWKVKITLIYDESLLSDQPPWRSLTSRYYGSKISRSQQFFLTETAICIVERRKKSMGYRFVPECNHAQESHTCQFFLFFFCYTCRTTVCWGPEIFYHGNVT